MLRLHQDNSSRKWRLMVKNAKMEKSDLSLNTYQYVEDFKVCVLATGNAHRLQSELTASSKFSKVLELISSRKMSGFKPLTKH